jgi:hypothetical protein
MPSAKFRIGGARVAWSEDEINRGATALIVEHDQKTNTYNI